MTIDSAASLGALGIRRGMQGLRESASQIAGAGTAGAPAPNDTTAALVALKQQEQQVAAAAEVVKSADGMIGTLIDDLA